MLNALIVLVVAVIALALFLLAFVAAAIRQEPPSAEFSSWAPNPLAALARRLLGVHVLKPDSPDNADWQPCLTGHVAAGPADDEGR